MEPLSLFYVQTTSDLWHNIIVFICQWSSAYQNGLLNCLSASTMYWTAAELTSKWTKTTVCLFGLQQSSDKHSHLFKQADDQGKETRFRTKQSSSECARVENNKTNLNKEFPAKDKYPQYEVCILKCCITELYDQTSCVVCCLSECGFANRQKRKNFYAFNLSLPTCSNLFSLNHHSQIDSCFQSLSYFLMFHPIITSFIFHMFYLKV